jgi:iron complex transport system ATP-binding protein
MSTMLEFRDLGFARGVRQVLEGVTARIASGEMVALMGPNGAGKTTLLKLAARLLEPDCGRVLLEGRPLSDWTRQEIARHVALVPQELEMPFAFRVEEIVAQGRVPHLRLFGGMSGDDREQVEEAMRAVDILGLRHRTYEELSGGERQRVKIAIGLAQESRLMLLDEPTQHLDIGRQIELLDLLRRLNQSGITIVAAMHDLALVRDNFSSGILLTPEPAYVAGPIAEIFTPELLERAFSVDRAALRGLLRTDEFASPSAPALSPEMDVAENWPHRGVKGRPRHLRFLAPGSRPKH